MVSAYDHDLLAKAKRGESLTQDEQNRLFSKTAAPGLIYSENYGGGETGAGYNGGTVSNEKGTDTGYGALAGTAVGTAANVAGIPGSRTLGNLTNDSFSGKPASETTTNAVINAFSDMASTYGGYLGKAASAAIGIARSDNPAMATASTVGSTLGGLIGAVAGIPGALVGSMIGSTLGKASYGSFTDGLIGDALDTRSYETSRERAENLGYSYSQTAAAAAEQESSDSLAGSGYKGLSPGLSASGYGLSPSLSDLESGVRVTGRTALSDEPSTALGNAAAASIGDLGDMGDVGDSIGGEGFGGNGPEGGGMGGGIGGGLGGTGDAGGTGATGVA